MATNQGIAKMFALLRRAYPNQLQKQLDGYDMRKGKEDATRQMMMFYQTFFQDIDDEVLVAGVAWWIADDNEWWPKIGKIRTKCAELILGDTTAAMEAWGTVVRYMNQPKSRYHNGKSVKLAPLPDIMEKTVRDLGGWRYLRYSENTMSDRARFVDAYNVRAARQRNKATMLPQVKAVAEALRLEAGEASKEIEGGS